MSSLSDLFRSWSSSVIYNIYNILSKLNLIHRTRYKDTVKSQVNFPLDVQSKVAGTRYFSVLVGYNFIKEQHIYIDAFKSKSGKTLRVNKNEVDTHIFMCFNVKESKFTPVPNSSDQFSMDITGKKTLRLSLNSEDFTLREETLDLSPVNNLVFGYMIGFDESCMNKEELEYAYDYYADTIAEYLNSIHWEDLKQ